MITALIVDDEEASRELIKKMISKHAPHVVVIGEASNHKQAVEIIQLKLPNLLFLDIDLGGGFTGFDVLDSLEDVDEMAVVFITTYNQYAIKAFRYAAVDYLLKPVVESEFSETLGRVEAKQSKLYIGKGEIEVLREQLLDLYSLSQKQRFLQVRGYEGVTLVPIDEILFLRGDGSYTRIVKTDGTELVASKLLHYYGIQLEKIGFFVRVHKSYIANTNHIRFISKIDNGQLVFNNNVKIPITFYDKVKEWLSH